MDLVKMRAGLLLRRGWRATLVLALLAGLAAGVAMAALATARRASTSFDRFLAHSAPADLLVNFCPPWLETIDDESLVECFRYDAVDEARRVAALPEVAEAGRVSVRRLDGICRLRSEPDVAGQRSRDVGRRAGGHRRRPDHRRGPHSRPGGAGRGLRQRAVR